MKSQNHTFSTQHLTSFLLGVDALKMGTPSIGSPILWPHTMITADGTVVTLISRDCCPYIDDPEPNYVNPAVVATQEVGNSVTWDPAFVSDEPSEPAGVRSAKSKTVGSVSTGPRTYADYGVLSVSTGGPARNRWSDLADEEEYEYEGMAPTNFTAPGEDCSSVGEHEDEENGWGCVRSYRSITQGESLPRCWTPSWC